MNHIVISGPQGSGKTSLMDIIASTHTHAPVLELIGTSLKNKSDVKWDGSLSSASLILVDEIEDFEPLLKISRQFKKLIPAPAMIFCIGFPMGYQWAADYGFVLIRLNTHDKNFW